MKKRDISDVGAVSRYTEKAFFFSLSFFFFLRALLNMDPSTAAQLLMNTAAMPATVADKERFSNLMTKVAEQKLLEQLKANRLTTLTTTHLQSKNMNSNAYMPTNRLAAFVVHGGKPLSETSGERMSSHSPFSSRLRGTIQ
jgi:hypothetical protein